MKTHQQAMEERFPKRWNQMKQEYDGAEREQKKIREQQHDNATSIKVSDNLAEKQRDIADPFETIEGVITRLLQDYYKTKKYKELSLWERSDRWAPSGGELSILDYFSD